MIHVIYSGHAPFFLIIICEDMQVFKQLGRKTAEEEMSLGTGLEVTCSSKETLFSTSFTIVAGEVSCLLSVLHADLHEDHVISQISHVTTISICITPVEPELSAGWSRSAVTFQFMLLLL